MSLPDVALEPKDPATILYTGGTTGVPHDVLGEEVGAVVVPRPGAALTGDDVRAFAAERLAAFEVPSHVWLRTEPLPVSPIGKVLTQQLRDEIRKRDGASSR